MSFFKQRKHKRFSYKSRLEAKDESYKSDLESKWRGIKREESKGVSFRSLPVLLILLVMALILMYILQTYE